MPNRAHKLGNDVVIELGNGLVTVVDEPDYWKVSGYNWYASHTSKSRDGVYYALSQQSGKTIYMHRIIMDAPKGKQVDHIDHNPLNNRRANLRIVSNQENNVNREGAYRTSQSGVRGVSIHKSNNQHRDWYWVFRCHCVGCKTCKYFPYSDEGLILATAFASEHHASHT